LYSLEKIGTIPLYFSENIDPKIPGAMYLEYFGFKETPFSIAPDPRYLFMSERHREALAHLLYGIQSEGGFVLLTGEVGTGKTTVCRCLLEQVPESTDIALVLNPRLTAPELLASICDELRIDYRDGNASIKLFVDLINAHLLDAHSRGRRTVLIIDEAQNLGVEVLEQIRLLTNLETDRQKLLKIILLGQPELLDLLSRPELRQLSQRITARYHLGALSRAEVAAYVKHRLEVAGMQRQIFSSKIIDRLYTLSSGIPRLVNIICDRALLGTFVQERQVVDRRTLERAAREVFGEARGEGKKKVSGWRILFVGSFLAAVLTIGAGLAWQWPLVVGIGTLVPSTQAIPGPTSEKRAETAVPATPGGEWVMKLIPDRSGDTAFSALFRKWGISFRPGEDGSACDFARAKGLLCLSETGSFRTLDLLNRPAVIKLFDGQGDEFYAALVKMEEDSAVLIAGNEKEKVPLEEIRKMWMGDFTLLWQPPPGFQGAISTGDRGGEVRWLDRQLAVIEGRPPSSLHSPVFDESMSGRVKKFQISMGLVPDGVVGSRTLILLNTAAGREVPLLKAGK
jgi:general secretion pathway protein A